MYDRPALTELIDAVRMHLETRVIPAVRDDRKLYFQTLVATNVLRIAGRELEYGGAHLRAQWGRINALLEDESSLPSGDQAARELLVARSERLAAAIRAGVFDAAGQQREMLYEHLQASAIEALIVANPRLLQTLVQEGQNPDLDAWEGRNRAE
jgi:hypothetical protein